jgi:hypothetical protein
LETICSSSFENCSSIVELTFTTTPSFRKTEQKWKRRVQLHNEKGDEVNLNEKIDLGVLLV